MKNFMQKLVKNLKNQEGIGIIEVVISFVVLGIMVAAIAPIMRSNVWTLENTLARNAATYKAERILDSLQMAGIHQVDTVVDFSCKDTNDKREFTCSIVPDSMTVNFGVETSKRVKVDVKWTLDRVHTLSVEGVVQ